VAYRLILSSRPAGRLLVAFPAVVCFNFREGPTKGKKKEHKAGGDGTALFYYKTGRPTLRCGGGRRLGWRRPLLLLIRLRPVARFEPVTAKGTWFRPIQCLLTGQRLIR